MSILCWIWFESAYLTQGTSTFFESSRKINFKDVEYIILLVSGLKSGLCLRVWMLGLSKTRHSWSHLPSSQTFLWLTRISWRALMEQESISVSLHLAICYEKSGKCYVQYLEFELVVRGRSVRTVRLSYLIVFQDNYVIKLSYI